jgi:hypothetical protein
LIGVFSSVGNLMYSHMKDTMPPGMVGTAVTGVNFFTMIGPAFFLQLTGFFMHAEESASPADGMALARIFQVCGICLFFVAGLYVLTSGRNRTVPPADRPAP